MRKVLFSAVILAIVVVVILAGFALRPVSAPSDSPNATPTVAEACSVIQLDGTPLSPQEAAVQDAVYNQLNQVKPPLALPLTDTGLSVTPAASKCVPLEDDK